MKCDEGKVDKVRCRDEICAIEPWEIWAMELYLYIL